MNRATRPTMNTQIISPVEVVAEALAKGWISFPTPPAPAPQPAPAPTAPTKPLSRYERYDKPRRAKLAALGLTTRGTPRKQHSVKRPEVYEMAQKDGVSVAAVYNRIKRLGRPTL